MENEIININIIVATDRLLHDFPSPSQDQSNPTAVAHDYFYMVANGAAIQPTGSGTGNLAFTADQGDVLRISSVSEYNNYENAVVLYGEFNYKGDQIFNGPFNLETFSGVESPVPTQFNPLKVKFNQESYWFAQNTFNNKGTAGIGYQFALYQNVRGKSDPVLHGYFQWDPQITVV